MSADPNEAIQLVFDSITEPAAARSLVRTIKADVPIDVIVESLTTALHGEGIVSPQAIPVITPALTAMIEGMAKMAGVTTRLSEKPDPWTVIADEEIDAMADKIVGIVDDIPEEANSLQAPSSDSENTEGGFMSRPTEGVE